MLKESVILKYVSNLLTTILWDYLEIFKFQNIALAKGFYIEVNKP